VVVRGEGEQVLVEVVTDVLSDLPIRPHPGLCYRFEGRSIAIPQDSSPQLSMADVPRPTYDDFFKQLARSPLQADLFPEIAILFESSRGCWWGAKSHCTFCGLNAATMKFRSKPASRVAEEIRAFAERYKILSFVAVDDIIDLGHIRELLPLLREVGDLEIFYETKANLTKEQVQAFRSAGVIDIQPGIESLSTPILRLMRKGVTALQNLRLLKWCAELGVNPMWNLLYGFPAEPPEEYERMTKLVPSLVHLKAPNFSHVQVQRFSPYFERAAEFGIEVTGPMPYYRFLYQIASDDLTNLAYDFAHRYDDGRDPETYIQGLREAVEKWREANKQGFGSLNYRRGPGFLIVQDRRPGLEPADYRFDGPEAQIYLGCDAGATAAELCAQLAAYGEDSLDVEEIAEFLDELVAARLMYREENRYLALAIAPSAGQPMVVEAERKHRHPTKTGEAELSVGQAAGVRVG
jgi:ribosomal peptide maturation radical SAM protein 1